MTDYKRAYHILCAAAASHALDVLPDVPENAAGRTVIQEALLEAEDVCIESMDEDERGAEK